MNSLTVKRFLDYLVFLLVKLMEHALCIIPEKAAMSFGRFVGRLGYVLFPDRRKAAIENLTLAFGREKSREWIVRTAHKSFEHLGLLGVEFFRLRRWTEKEMAERILLQGVANFNLAMLPGNHGIVLLNSHFGCFEVSAATVKHLGMKLNVVVTGLKNPFLSRYMFTRAGKNSGITTFPHKGIVKEMIARLRQGEMMACLADQRGDAERGIFVDFFGTPAPANEVFAKMAIEGQGRILPLCTYRLDDGRYQSIFGEEIRIELTGDQRQDLINVSQQFHDKFEQWLRIDPAQGFWVQRKWRRKSRRRRKAQVQANSQPASQDRPEEAKKAASGFGN
jgi:Kdo2-lipid IVA lauroyltransferase/acyltransferase